MLLLLDGRGDLVDHRDDPRLRDSVLPGRFCAVAVMHANRRWREARCWRTAAPGAPGGAGRSARIEVNRGVHPDSTCRVWRPDPGSGWSSGGSLMEARGAWRGIHSHPHA